jgi:NAD-dependent dihydropyrimidine dehydrogenase PreA subunit
MTPDVEKADLLGLLKAPRRKSDQPLFTSGPLKQTRRIMVKDENLCIHCSLCAERCPTAAWDMKKSLFKFARAIDHDGQNQNGRNPCQKAG